MSVFGLFGVGVLNTVAPDFYRRRNDVEQAETEGEWEAGRGSAVKKMRGEPDFYPCRSAVEQVAMEGCGRRQFDSEEDERSNKFSFSDRIFFFKTEQVGLGVRVIFTYNRSIPVVHSFLFLIFSTVMM